MVLPTWLVLSPLEGVDREVLAELARFEQAQLFDDPSALPRPMRILSDQPEDDVERERARFSGAMLREYYGLGFTPEERLETVRRVASSTLAGFWRWHIVTRMQASTTDEAQLATISALANTLGSDVDAQDRWIYSGALDRAIQGGPASATAGSIVRLDDEHDRARAEWLLADPSRVANVEWVRVESRDPEWLRGVLSRLKGRSAKIRLLSQTDWTGIAAALPDDCTGVDLSFARSGLAFVSELVKSPAWASIRTLQLHNNQLGAEGLGVLIAAEKPGGLDGLDLGYNNLDAAAFTRLAKAPWLAGVRSLNVAFNEAKSKGAKALFSSPSLSELTWLDVGANEIGDPGIETLGKSDHLTKLEHLACRGNNRAPLLSPKSALALGAWRGAATLRSLDLASNKLGDEGVAALVQGANLRGVIRLDVHDNCCTPALAAALAGIEGTMRPKVVNLGANKLGRARSGQAQKPPKEPAPDNPWANAHWLRECESLDLSLTSLDVDTMAQIVASPQLARLRALSLWGNNSLGTEALRFLLRTRLPSQLEVLELHGWALGGEGVALLLESPLLDTVKRLLLTAKGIAPRDLSALHERLGDRIFIFPS